MCIRDRYGEVPGMMYGGMASKGGLVDGPGGYAGKKKDKEKFEEVIFTIHLNMPKKV